MLNKIINNLYFKLHCNVAIRPNIPTTQFYKHTFKSDKYKLKNKINRDIPSREIFTSCGRFIRYIMKKNINAIIITIFLSLLLSVLTIYLLSSISYVVKCFFGVFEVYIIKVVLSNRSNDYMEEEYAMASSLDEMIKTMSQVNKATGQKRMASMVNYLSNTYFRKITYEKIRTIIDSTPNEELKKMLKNIHQMDRKRKIDCINEAIDYVKAHKSDNDGSYQSLIKLQGLLDQEEIIKKSLAQVILDPANNDYYKSIMASVSPILGFLDLDGHKPVIAQLDEFGSYIFNSILQQIYPLVVASNDITIMRNAFGINDIVNYNIDYSNKDLDIKLINSQYFSLEQKVLDLVHKIFNEYINDIIENKLSSENKQKTKEIFYERIRELGNEDGVLQKLIEQIPIKTDFTAQGITKTIIDCLEKPANNIVKDQIHNNTLYDFLMEKANEYLKDAVVETKVYSPKEILKLNGKQSVVKSNYDKLQALYYDKLAALLPKKLNALFLSNRVEKNANDKLIEEINSSFKKICERRGLINSSKSKFLLLSLIKGETIARQFCSEYNRFLKERQKNKILPSKRITKLYSIIRKGQDVRDYNNGEISKFTAEAAINIDAYLSSLFLNLDKNKEPDIEKIHNEIENIMDAVQKIIVDKNHKGNANSEELYKAAKEEVREYGKYMLHQHVWTFYDNKIKNMDNDKIFFQEDILEIESIDDLLAQIRKMYSNTVKTPVGWFKRNYSTDEISPMMIKDSRAVINLLREIQKLSHNSEPINISEEQNNNILSLIEIIKNDIAKKHINTRQNIYDHMCALYDYSEFSIEFFLSSKEKWKERFLYALFLFPYFQFIIMLGLVKIMEKAIKNQIALSIENISQKTSSNIVNYVLDTTNQENMFSTVNELSQLVETFFNKFLKNIMEAMDIFMIIGVLYYKDKFREISLCITAAVLTYIVVMLTLSLATFDINKHLELKDKIQNNLLETCSTKQVIQFLGIKPEIMKKQDNLYYRQYINKKKHVTQIILEYFTYVSLLVFLFSSILKYVLQNKILDKSEGVINILYLIGFVLLNKYTMVPENIIENIMIYKTMAKYVENINKLHPIDRKGIIPYDLRGKIRFNNVSFGYGNKKIFENISLDLEDNKTYAIIGFSGEGKSTFVNLLLNLIQPTKGSITVNNNPINVFNPMEYINQISFVPQDTSCLRNAPVLENITDGNSNITKHQAQRLLKKCKLDMLASDDAIYKNIGIGGCSLSGGQRQRLMIARALAKASHCDMLVFDEPLSSLDPNVSHTITSLISNIVSSSKNKKVFIIDHSGKAINITQDIIFINKGKVHVSTHKRLLEENDVYRKYFIKK